MPKRTNNPSKSKRSRRHGFLSRMSTRSGARVLKNRRSKKRTRLSV